MKKYDAETKESKLMMSRYMVIFWGIVVSPILSIVFMALNMKKSGHSQWLSAMLIAALVYLLLVVLVLQLNIHLMYSWAVSTIFTILFVRWAWEKYMVEV